MEQQPKVSDAKEKEKTEMKLGHEKNGYGTLVTRFKCEYCGREFTVCPAVPPDKEANWRGCLAPECPSYDPGRDADKLFETDPGAIEQRPVKPLNAK